MIKQALFKGGHSDGCRDHYSGGERLDSTLILIRTSGRFIFKKLGGGGQWMESY